MVLSKYRGFTKTRLQVTCGEKAGVPAIRYPAGILMNLEGNIYLLPIPVGKNTKLMHQNLLLVFSLLPSIDKIIHYLITVPKFKYYYNVKNF